MYIFLFNMLKTVYVLAKEIRASRPRLYTQLIRTRYVRSASARRDFILVVLVDLRPFVVGRGLTYKYDPLL